MAHIVARITRNNGYSQKKVYNVQLSENRREPVRTRFVKERDLHGYIYYLYRNYDSLSIIKI